MAFNYATLQEQNKKRDKAAKAAQTWLKREFTPEQVAKGIWNKVGYVTSVEDGKVQIHGFNNDENRSAMRVLREITAEKITKFD